jgi:TrmH family RNA methyltransferase
MVLTHKLQNSRTERYAKGLYVADGTKLLEEAVRWDTGLDTVILRDDLQLAFSLPSGVREVRVPESLMRQISAMEAPQGALFLGRIPDREAFSLQPGSLILDGIQDPGNLGTILRTADALEIPVVLSEGCADPYNPKTIRASMGAVFRTPPVQAQRVEVIAAAKASQIPLYVTALTEQARDLRQVSLESAAVVIGSEGRGVCADYCAQADGNVLIPMNPRCESLNAATAATILMWEIYR